MPKSAAATWTAAELTALGRAGEIRIASRRADGTLRSARIVWLVRHGDAVYVRSVNGVDAAWYRGVQTAHQGHLSGPVDRDVTFVEVGEHVDGDTALEEALDAEYRAKYGATSSPVARITSAAARATTLRIDPA